MERGGRWPARFRRYRGGDQELREGDLAESQRSPRRACTSEAQAEAVVFLAGRIVSVARAVDATRIGQRLGAPVPGRSVDRCAPHLAIGTHDPIHKIVRPVVRIARDRIAGRSAEWGHRRVGRDVAVETRVRVDFPVDCPM